MTHPRPLEIIGLVSSYYGVAAADVRGRCRTKTVARARAVAMWLLRFGGFSLAEIGAAFGTFDHSAALYAIRRIECQSRFDDELSWQLAALQGKAALLANQSMNNFAEAI